MFNRRRYRNAVSGIALILTNICVLEPVVAAIPEPNIATPNSESWDVATAWVGAVTPHEQIIVLLMLRSALNNNLSQTVFLRKDVTVEDRLWGRKSIAAGNFLLRKLATKSPSMVTALDFYCNNINGLIDGSISESQYEISLVTATSLFSNALRSVDALEAENTKIKYDARLRQTSARLIGSAKTLASR